MIVNKVLLMHDFTFFLQIDDQTIVKLLEAGEKVNYVLGSNEQYYCRVFPPNIFEGVDIL